MYRALTVIIAEDKPLERQNLEDYTNQLGWKVVSSVGSGEWLLDDCIKYEPDIVFLDVDLNGTDGIAAYKSILDHGLKPYLIMVSDLFDSDLILAGLDMNCVDFLTRPISYERFMEAAEKATVLVEKDLFFSRSVPGNIIKIKSNYRTFFMNENNFIYAHKVKGEHKAIVYAEGIKESGVETTTSLTDIQSQCSDFIFAPNRSNLINVNYIKSVFASDKFSGTYIIKLGYKDIEIDLTRRKRKEFEQLFFTSNEF
ncbi:response regulator [Paenibacillus melissococcoides]|uniref:Response regulator n=1 Tax=Paenibacillus melissococcoides TaxID=2912268 RepID=A0ABN8UI53_9BACL|nr:MULTISPECIES: response regulator [Paenibacillus]MEB9897601.1 response regulator [Bacillus cereus]GIO82306.1 DNA-binding response regulator [Paenibacillus dendritiformis]CAH8249561.1 response regulator [Paenibacillus melissococcoides]CAH8721070.1 response regulator [Paenibacillus melissococcoides]